MSKVLCIGQEKAKRCVCVCACAKGPWLADGNLLQSYVFECVGNEHGYSTMYCFMIRPGHGKKLWFFLLFYFACLPCARHA